MPKSRRLSLLQVTAMAMAAAGPVAGAQAPVSPSLEPRAEAAEIASRLEWLNSRLPGDLRQEIEERGELGQWFAFFNCFQGWWRNC